MVLFAGMASKIVVSHNFSRLTALMSGLGDKRSLQQAVARSIKRTVPSVQRAAFQEIRSKKLLRIKASEMKSRARAYLEVGGSKAVSQQYGKVWITPQAESLGRFYPRRIAAGRSQIVMGQNKEGGWQGVRLYRVKLNPFGQPYLKNADRSFVVDRGGGKVVFERMAGAKRLPIEKLKGPGMAALVRQTGIDRRLAQVAETRYRVEFAVNAKYYADRAWARAMKGK